MSEKLHPALVGGLHPFYAPEIAKAADKCRKLQGERNEHWSVWIRPNSPSPFTCPSEDGGVMGCVCVFDTETGWISIPGVDDITPEAP